MRLFKILLSNALHLGIRTIRVIKVQDIHGSKKDDECTHNNEIMKILPIRI